MGLFDACLTKLVMAEQITHKAAVGARELYLRGYGNNRTVGGITIRTGPRSGLGIRVYTKQVSVWC